MGAANEQGNDPNFLQRYAALPPQKTDADFNRWLEQSDDILNLLEHDLRGDILIEDKTGIYWESKGKPLLNEIGIRFVVGYLRHFANKNTYMSDLGEDRVGEICLATTLSLTDALFFRWVEFGINPDNFSVIVEHVNNIIEFAARRAMHGGERKFLKQTENIVRHYTSNPKEGGIGLPNIFGGKR